MPMNSLLSKFAVSRIWETYAVLSVVAATGLMPA
jgi:hypothetical protein